MTSCHPIVVQLAASVKNSKMLPVAFATSVLQGLRRTLDEIIGAIDDVEAEPTVEEECSAQKNVYESGQVSFDGSTGLPLDTKMVAHAIKDELMFMRELQVNHEVLVSYVDKSGLKAAGTRWVYTNKVWCCKSIWPRTAGCARNQESEPVDTGRVEHHACGHAATGKLQFRAQTMHDWFWRAPVDVKVLGFCDINRAHFHSPARRTIVIKVPREDDERKSWCSAVLRYRK